MVRGGSRRWTWQNDRQKLLSEFECGWICRVSWRRRGRSRTGRTRTGSSAPSALRCCDGGICIAASICSTTRPPLRWSMACPFTPSASWRPAPHRRRSRRPPVGLAGTERRRPLGARRRSTPVGPDDRGTAPSRARSVQGIGLSLRCRNGPKYEAAVHREVRAHVTSGVHRFPIGVLRLRDPADFKQTVTDQHVAGCGENWDSEGADLVQELLCADEAFSRIAEQTSADQSDGGQHRPVRIAAVGCSSDVTSARQGTRRRPGAPSPVAPVRRAQMDRASEGHPPTSARVGRSARRPAAISQRSRGRTPQ